ncbi:MAG: hypothetical protein ACRDQ5_13040 [Sciscionella sp.]
MLGGVSALVRRLLRRRVPAGVGPPRDDTGGAAGVREPRRPRPSGPSAAAAAVPEPEPSESITAQLPDPRR